MGPDLKPSANSDGTLAAVIGSPVGHSLSPAIHNAAFKAVGLSWLFVAWEVPDGLAGEALSAMKSLGMAGLSVTMPHKTAVAEAVDTLSPQAKKLQAVNCVEHQGNQLVGHNTDGIGFLASLRAEADFEPRDKTALVVGAGGAARAVVLALAEAGAADIGVLNRTPARAQAAADLAPEVARPAAHREVGGFDLVVNATPVGMAGSGGDLPLPVDDLHSEQLLVDLIYEPPETPLLQAARARDVPAIGGLGMLVHQAAAAFEIWTQRPAPVEVMAEAVAAAVKSKMSSAPAANF